MSPPFTDRLSRLLPESIRGYYLAYSKPVNYAFVCGVVGVLVNYLTYHALLAMFAGLEPIVFYAGVGVGAVSNYLFTRGPLDYLFFEEEKHELPHE